MATLLFGSTLAPESRLAVSDAHAANPLRGVATLFMLPEFQWR